MFPSADTKLILNVKVRFTAEKVSAVKQSNALLYWYGNICYLDAFGKTRYTNYCFTYKGNSMTSKDADECLLHNDSD